MNHRFFALLLGCLAPFGTALAADSECSCDNLKACTQVNDIPIVFAARDVVRKKFLNLGAKLLEKGGFIDDFAAPADVPYKHVTAYYAEGRRLAQLSFSYPKEDFDRIVTAYATIGVIADRGQQGADGKSWRMVDGSEIRVRQYKGATFVDFIALAVDAQLDVLLKPGYRSPIDRKAEAQPARDANAPPLSITTSNPHQGLFEFHSEGAPLLLGKRDLREEVCGAAEDFDWTTLDRHGEIDEDRSLYVELRGDSHATVKLALKDEFGADIYRFLDVQPGKQMPASADGDCRRRKVSVTWTATHSPRCLLVNATNQPTYEVVQKLVEVTGVRVEGTELLPRKEARVTFRDLEMSVSDLLRLLGDVVDMEIVEKEPAHFEFRKPTRPAH